MSHRPSPGARLRYRFDNTLARGPVVVVAYLALVSLFIVALAAFIVVIGGLSYDGERPTGFLEAMWQAMLRTLDPGTFSGETGWPIRFVALGVTLAGLFIVVALIGLIANAVDTKVEELRRGRSPVVESGHTLILGWSAQVPRIISELIIANESERRAAIVVLAAEDKVVMEDLLRDTIQDRRTTRIVCRTGNPALPADLERSGVSTARSIVAVRPASADGGVADAEVIKAVLAVRALDPQLAQAHIVAELEAADNSEVIRSVTGGRVLTVSSDRVVAEVTAQACLQPGLSAVFTDLLDFDGDEIYFTPVGELGGGSYGEAVLAFDSCSVIGHRTTDGKVELNPSPETLLQPGAELVVVAADDSAIYQSPWTGERPRTGGARPRPVERPKRLTIIGWSEFGAKVLRELDEFLPEGSQLSILVDADLVDPAGVQAVQMRNGSVEVQGGTGGPDDIRRLSDEPPDQVIVLGYRDALAVDEADARTLLTLLTLRTVWPAHQGTKHVRIVAELLDQRNLVLADTEGVDDLIVSNALSSLVMAQLAERADLEAVFDDLFDAQGAVIDMCPATDLVEPGSYPFGAVVTTGISAGASVFGYRRGASGKVVLNPPKSEKITLGADDHVVMISGRLAAPPAI